MRRRFNTLERVILRWIHHGRCSLCGKDLPVKWHPDHVIPYAAGGCTIITNGQPTCPTCNQKKGAKMPLEPLQPWQHLLRAWQQNTHEKFMAELPQDALIVAVPGAGKTLMACRIIHSLLAAGAVTSTIIVAPSVPLIYQWVDDAYAKAGIQLCPLEPRTMVGGVYPDDFHGLVTTYHTLQGKDGQLAIAAILHKHHGRVLAVVDEIHHAATSLAWGAALENAFDRAAYRVLLSGTPFRTDGIPLPFINYDTKGNCIPFDTYSYAQGLTDKVCRRIVFPKYDGQLEYWNGEEIIETTFHDNVSESLAHQRLKAAITSDWLDGVIQDAHERLCICRQNGHADAGGLIVCIDDFHARKVMERVRSITGTTPVLVTHREEDAQRKITEFKTTTKPWIVAVRLISEGVDIPRLRVGIYATNILTELYFWQFCGRFIRVIPDLECEQDAFIFIPSDPVLKSYAQEIYEERERQLRQVLDAILEEEGPDEEPPPENPELLRYRSIYGIGSAEQDGAIFLQGIEVSREEYQFACAHVPSHLQNETSLLAAILALRAVQGNTKPPTPPAATHQTTADSNQQLRIVAMHHETDLIQVLHRRLLDTGKLTKDPDTDERFFSHFQHSLNQRVGVKDKRLCSLEQFKQRALYIRQCIRSGSYAS
jgi:superfamily II DNA or RNA helicase